MERLPSNVDLYIVGAGVAFPHHLTLQAIEILSACTAICTNLPQESVSRLPFDLSQKCRSLWPLYQEGRIRSDNYRDVTEAILKEVETSPPTAWLTPGHPMVFDSVSTALLKAAALRKWSTRIVPGISSIDTLFADIEYDPAQGISIYDATSLVCRNVPITTSTPLILLQVGAFLSERAQLTLKTAALDLCPLRDYLVKYFPIGHECALIHSSYRIDLTPRIIWTTLRELPLLTAADYAGGNLFIPAVKDTA